MNIPYLRITGWGDAIRALYMSNKNYTPELEKRISEAEIAHELMQYNHMTLSDPTELNWFLNEINKVIKYGNKHITLLRYVDVAWVVVGLHRGAQDDFDAHAERYDNRIVRMSTRTKNDEKLAEVSDWYKDKILTWQDLEKIFELPEEVSTEKGDFVRTAFGYIRKDFIGTKEEGDVRRGNVPLAVASTFMVKCQVTELCHVFRERNEKGNAAPELKAMMEMLVKMISDQYPNLNRDFFLNSCLQ